MLSGLVDVVALRRRDDSPEAGCGPFALLVIAVVTPGVLVTRARRGSAQRPGRPCTAPRPSRDDRARHGAVARGLACATRRVARPGSPASTASSPPCARRA